MLLLASGARAEDKYSLFGIVIGDNINKYNPKNEGLIPHSFIVDPPKPNSDFILYFAGINKKTNQIIYVGGIHKKNYILEGTEWDDEQKVIAFANKCKIENKEYVKIIANGDQFKKFNLDIGDFDKYLPNNSVYIFQGDKINFGIDGNIKFSINIDCINRHGNLIKGEKDGLRPKIILMDHRNLYQAVEDNRVIENKKIDKSGLK